MTLLTVAAGLSTPHSMRLAIAHGVRATSQCVDVRVFGVVRQGRTKDSRETKVGKAVRVPEVYSPSGVDASEKYPFGQPLVGVSK